MATLRNLATKYSNLNEDELEWLELLALDLPLLADLALSDVVLWVPTEKGDDYLAVAHSRPAGYITLFYRDIIGDFLRPDWREVVDETLRTEQPAASTSPAWYEENPMRLTAFSISRRDPQGNVYGPFAVATVHTSANDVQHASRIAAAFREVSSDLLGMTQSGAFPNPGGLGGQQGAPRATDGLVRVNLDGIATFVSPNTQTTFTKLGYRVEIEGENFSEVLAEVLKGQFDTNESLPLISQGKIAKRTEIFARGHSVAMRAIPVYRGGERVGGIVLTRDVSELRQQAQELITKDATIREIHHRVKNNLQTVASLLRVQARRARSEEAKQVLGQAMRRVGAIAVVHDTLSTGLAQIVDFDVVFERVLGLAAEVASLHGTTVHPRKEGLFGQLPSEYATPLALALTEIVTNAVEHGLAGREGEVFISADRTEARLLVEVVDTGTGLPGGTVGDGLGTQIVRTLIEGELGGAITWGADAGGGTRVSIQVPLHWLAAETRPIPRIA